MNQTQKLALAAVCKTQDDLQVVWNNPAVFKFSKKYQAYVTMCVVEESVGDEEPKLKWTAGIRLANPLKKTFKPTSTWMQDERWQAQRMLDDQLQGVGGTEIEQFDTRVGMHLNKNVTPAEAVLIYSPNLLAAAQTVEKTNGHRPQLSRKIVNPKDATKLLDKLEKDLKEGNSDA